MGWSGSDYKQILLNKHCGFSRAISLNQNRFCFDQCFSNCGAQRSHSLIRGVAGLTKIKVISNIVFKRTVFVFVYGSGGSLDLFNPIREWLRNQQIYIDIVFLIDIFIA